MTPRAGVKTTLASEMRLPGLPDPKRGPHFFSTNKLGLGNAARNISHTHSKALIVENPIAPKIVQIVRDLSE
jgi:hypothetical protein